MQCIKCQQETKNKKFCSRSCANSYNNEKYPKRKLGKNKCKLCNKAIFSGYTYCSKCFISEKLIDPSTTLEECQNKLSLKGKHPSWKNVYIRNHCRTYNKHLTKKPCFNCGYDKHVELCHKTSLKETPSHKKLSEVNHENNILVLCRNCHWEYDNGFINF